MVPMCYAVDARPPPPPILGGSTDDTELLLTATDDNRLLAYAARAAKATGAGIVVMPDVRGLHPFYKELARRFAQAGVDAVAIDYFGRRAGIGDRSGDFDFMSHVKQTTPEGVAADVAAGLAYLRAPAGGGASSTFTVGFCFGGSLSWRPSAAQPGFAGALGFFRPPGRVRGAIPQMKAPPPLLI